jgi:hypothetical protein
MEKLDRKHFMEVKPCKFTAEASDLGWAWGQPRSGHRPEKIEVPSLGTFSLTAWDGFVWNYAQDDGATKITVFND